jgi:glycosyltransferase involved in cell wall biosynthesis
MTPLMLTEIAAITGMLATLTTLALKRFRGRGISIIIPFRSPNKGNQRVKNLEWLMRYWKTQLPGAEIIIGEDPEPDKPFSKSAAVNNGVEKSTGDVLVIVDADGYISPDSVLHCAKEIRHAIKRGQHLWFIPYRQFYRLTEEASRLLLASNPKRPVDFTEPVHPAHVLQDTDPTVGHWYGAMIQIMPREAFDCVGCWDERFIGWGGEDHAAMRAMDTLYSLHKTLPGQVLHVWHPQIGPQGSATQVHWKDRMWEGQASPQANDILSGRYYDAYRNVEKMQKLVNEAKDYRKHRDHHGHHHHHHHRHHHHHHRHSH